ncbi:putative glycoside hydrolase [Teredinibacter sp. KSP-S5-2]|uniref:putative glycoside hydrolase n=1 Tax=Teredinibacter sp. KSP-S5-2 TaxID=3034506 RepID=UPI0029346C08|nr:putative glycoside hydrolase [Teredinibacter sp. KSP-S5-2]WNO10810.1 putative glycoside hydrolase [Teredinibacter sp. KSP-S5-2]
MTRFLSLLVVMVSAALTACGGGLLADAGDDVTVSGGQQVELNGGAYAFNEDGSQAQVDTTLTYQWTHNGGESVLLLDSEGKVTTDNTTQKLIAFIPAELQGKSVEFTLVVNDGVTESIPDSVSVNVEPCTQQEGDVFIECVDPTWQGLSGWEMSEGLEPFNYFSGATQNHVQWSIQNLQDQAHNRVVDVQFNHSAVNGTFQLLTAKRGLSGYPEQEQLIDMTAFAGGQLKFDIRVLDMGLTENIWLQVECGWPCQSAPFQVPVAEVGQWQSVSFNVDDLQSIGLDLSKVGTALQINPDWNLQQGVHFQLDNIRWEKSGCVDQPGNVYGNCLDSKWGGFGAWDTEWNGNYFYTDVNNHVQWTEVFSGDPVRKNVLEISFNKDDVLGTFYIFPPQQLGPDFSEFINGDYVFDIKILSVGAETTSLVYNCGYPCNGTSHRIDKSLVDRWQEVRIPVSQLISDGMDITAVPVGINILPDWVIPQSGFRFQLDNIRFENPVVVQ